MRKWVNRGLAFGMSMLVSLSVCDVGRADDTKTGNDSKPASAKAAAEKKPETGLTDRERWLLERVEQLEKRVADLESKDAKPAAEPAVREKGAEPGTSGSSGMTATAKPSATAPSAALTSAPTGGGPTSIATTSASP